MSFLNFLMLLTAENLKHNNFKQFGTFKTFDSSSANMFFHVLVNVFQRWFINI